MLSKAIIVDLAGWLVIFVGILAFGVMLKLAERALMRRIHGGDLNKMDGFEFEDYIGELLRRRGYAVEQTPHSHDYGVDLIIAKDGERWAAQVKRYKGWVGQKAVREAVAGMAYYHCTRCMVITNSHQFGTQARRLAKANRCELVGGDEVNAWVREDRRRQRKPRATPAPADVRPAETWPAESRDAKPRSAESRPAVPVAPSVDLAAQARALMAQGRYLAAIQRWDQLIARDGPSADALAERSRAHERAGHIELAAADLAGAIQAAPTDARLHHALGLVHLGQGMYDAAIGDFGLALRLDPTAATSHHYRATAYMRIGAHQAAYDGFSAALALDPTMTDALTSRDLVVGQLREAGQVAVGAARQ